MLDSGAQVCVCPRNYAPECPLIPDPDKIDLRTVTGKKMTIHGIRYVDYRFPAEHWMLVKYYVCDVQDPVISSSGLVANNYSIVFDQAPQPLFFGNLSAHWLRFVDLRISNLLAADNYTWKN